MKRIIAFIGLALLATIAIGNVLYQFLYKIPSDFYARLGWRGFFVSLFMVAVFFTVFYLLVKFISWAIDTLAGD